MDYRVAKPLKDELRYRWESWMIDESEVHDGMTTNQPTREQIDSRTTAPPKENKLPCRELKHCKVSHSKQCRDLVGFLKNFNNSMPYKVSHGKHCRMHGLAEKVLK